MQELVLAAQLLISPALDASGELQSHPTAELCEMYARELRDHTLLSEERAEDPCLDMDNPLDYITD